MAAKPSSPVVGTAEVRAIDERLLIPLPEEASTALPSRGQVAVDAVLNGHELAMVVEPDGRKGHWLRVDESLQQALDLREGAAVDFTLTPTKAWPEPELPEEPGLKEPAVAVEPRKPWTTIGRLVSRKRAMSSSSRRMLSQTRATSVSPSSRAATISAR